MKLEMKKEKKFGSSYSKNMVNFVALFLKRKESSENFIDQRPLEQT